LIHARQDYNDRIQDLDIAGLKALFEEMLGELKANYLHPYTDPDMGSPLSVKSVLNTKKKVQK
jgi:hypothetical protein